MAAHAAVLYGVMMSVLIALIGWAIYWDTLQQNPALTAHSAQNYDVKAQDTRKRG